MKTFKDNENRTWTIAIHVTAVKKCRALVGVDLLGLLAEGFAGLNALLGDTVLLVDALYVLCQAEADARGVKDEDFGRALWGDPLGHATDAFIEELIDFFPDAAKRAALRAVFEKGRRVTERVIEMATAKVNRIDVDSEVKALMKSSGASPESSGSTPGPSPSESST